MAQYARISADNVVEEILEFPDDWNIDVANFYPRNSGMIIVPLPNDQLIDQKMGYDRAKGIFTSERQPVQTLLAEAGHMAEERRDEGILYEEQQVSATQDSLVNIDSLVKAVDSGVLSEPVRFVTKTGVLFLSRPQLEDLYGRVRAQFQEITDLEKSTYDAIKAGEFNTDIEVHNHVTLNTRTYREESRQAQPRYLARHDAHQQKLALKRDPNP